MGPEYSITTIEREIVFLEIFHAITYELEPQADMDDCKLCSDVVIPSLYNTLSITLARIILEVATNGEAGGVLDCIEAVNECENTCVYLECIGCVICKLRI